MSPVEAGIAQGLTDGAAGRFDQVGGQLVELCTGQGHVEVLRAGGVAVIYGRLMLVVVTPDSSIFAFSAASFRRCMATLSPLRSMPSVLLELADQLLDDALVEVVAAQAVVAGGGQNFDNAVADLQNGDIEGAAAQVVDHDLLVAPYPRRRPERRRSAR